MKILNLVLIVAALAVAASAQTYSNAQATALVNAAGIRVVSSGGCIDRNNPDCTSLDGIQKACIDGPSGIITLRRASGCTVTITGGTEAGHAWDGPHSHSNGWKLDIAMNSCLTNYIVSNFPRQPNGRYRAGSGNMYLNEGNHWDITFA